jgi:hypothetical protein
MRVQFLIAQFFTTDGTSDEAVPALADLKEYTERALTGIAVQGAAS